MGYMVKCIKRQIIDAVFDISDIVLSAKLSKSQIE
jgi:hypothetical protein